MNLPEEIKAALAQEIGTTQYWRVFPNDDVNVMTDGVKRMAEMCGAFWLVTGIFAWQWDERVKKEPFQVWKLTLNNDGSDGACLVCEDGGKKELARQEIDYTDFPLPEGIKLFLDGGVLMLPSEY
ncbi:hypothetical protein FACS1894216_20060 [Synergistales bacterium]|nr:hypothetical protein FACS1894216_20060 [Synergistales bacterium]